MRLFGRKKTLTFQEKQFWEVQGYLVLPRFFEPAEVEAVNAIVQDGIANPASFGNATVDVLHGELIGTRLRAAEAPSAAFHGPIKINDLFLDRAEVRKLALNGRLTRIVAQLLDGAPAICNSLNFIWGSQQPAHFDSWYMPPPAENKMVVSSICLEDVHPDAGPLVYYPGSHKLAPYKFSHGGIHAIESEMPACRAQLERELSRIGAEEKVFLGKQGDVFLWHGQLLHGGSKIGSAGRTRKTLVTHYWRAQDLEPNRVVKVHDTGYYISREHQAVS